MPKSDERFARQYRDELPPGFPLASFCSGIVHHLSGPTVYAQLVSFLRTTERWGRPSLGIPPKRQFLTTFTFISPLGFSTLWLAYTKDSPVRVSRRVNDNHLVSFISNVKAPEGTQNHKWICTLSNTSILTSENSNRWAITIINYNVASYQPSHLIHSDSKIDTDTSLCAFTQSILKFSSNHIDKKYSATNLQCQMIVTSHFWTPCDASIYWLSSIHSTRFQALVDSLFRVLCNFPSRYLFAIGLSQIFSLRWKLSPVFSMDFRPYLL